MNYTVIWKTSVLDHLADLYVGSSLPERERMAQGVESLNVRLAADPLNEGESRGGALRIVFLPLMTATFSVDEPNHTVRVINLTRYGH